MILPRKGIAIDEAIADSLAEEAAKQNKTLYAFANESLSDVLKVLKEGGTSKEIFPSWDFGRAFKDTDSLPIPGTLIEAIVKRMYAVDSKWLLNEILQEGAKVGSYLKLRFPEFEDLVPRLFELQAFLPVKRVEFERVSPNTEKMLISVRILGAGPSREATECAQQFLKGLMSQYPYKITYTRVTEGIIEATVTKE